MVQNLLLSVNVSVWSVDEPVIANTFYSFARLYKNQMTVKRNAALGFIFITILIDVIGFGIIYRYYLLLSSN